MFIKQFPTAGSDKSPEWVAVVAVVIERELEICSCAGLFCPFWEKNTRPVLPLPDRGFILL